MKLRFILGVLIILNNSFSQGQIIPIGNVDKNSDVQLFFVNVEGRAVKEEDQSEYEKLKFILDLDTTRGFVMNDKQKINDFVGNWKGKKSKEVLFCGYHYSIYVIKDGKFLDKLHVNIECKQVVSTRGVFNYEVDPFDKLEKSDKISSVDLALSAPTDFVNDLKTIPNLFWVEADYPSTRMRYFTEHWEELNSLVKKYARQQKP